MMQSCNIEISFLCPKNNPIPDTSTSGYQVWVAVTLKNTRRQRTNKEFTFFEAYNKIFEYIYCYYYIILVTHYRTLKTSLRYQGSQT